jgi:hypothetical protein
MEPYSSSASVNSIRFAVVAGGALFGNRPLLNSGKKRCTDLLIPLGTNATDYFFLLLLPPSVAKS